MNEDGNRLEYVDARYSGTHDTTLGAWNKRSMVFVCKYASFHGSTEVQLDMLYGHFPEDLKDVARLSTLVRFP